MAAALRLWRCRWPLVRLAVAAALLWVLVVDTGARLARLQLAALPEFDYAAEVRHLRESRRYGEALVIAEAGLAAQTSGEQRAALEREREAAAAEQASWLRRVRDLGMGALSGQGDSTEMLIGAVGADLFVVGDVRDIVLQGGKYLADGEADEVILALSAVGLATTLAPEIDWAPSVLKTARRAGAMTRGLSDFIVQAARNRRFDELRDLLGNVAQIARRASPGGAVRILRFADGPDDVARLARFVDRAEALGPRAGPAALHITGREGAALLKAADAAGDAAGAGVRAGDRLVVAASRKGAHGAAFLRTGNAKLLLKPHPIIGLTKGFYKGNVQELALRIAAATDGRAWWLIPLLATWAFLECAVIARRLSAAPATRLTSPP